MANEQVVAALREMASLLELKGESPFQVRAYLKAADRLIEVEDVASLVREGRNLTDLPGVGKTLAEKIIHFITTGSIPQLEKLRREVPAGVVDMASLSGLGPGRVATLRRELGIESVEQLEEAVREGKVEALKGFGVKTVAAIAGSIASWKKNRRIRLHRVAREEGEEIASRLVEGGAAQAAVAGRIGRWHETASAIDVVAGVEGDAVLASIVPGGMCVEKIEGGILFTGRTTIPVRVRAVRPEPFGAALLFATASPIHAERLASIAAERGMRLEKSGLFRGDEPVPTRDEESAYRELGLPFIPPELREGGDEIDLALAGRLPRLLERSDLRGVLHNHSTWSDGKASIREMAEHASALGFEYIGLADHSRTAGYAGGLSAERLLAQMEEVEKLRSEMAPFRIFHGVESDILKDGSLDYDDDLLSRLDYVVASIHSRYGMDREGITARLTAGASNRRTTILGHPSGRLLTERDPYDFDTGAVWDAAAKGGAAIELNAHEKRLDVDWREIPGVTARGLKIAISPDAHTRKGLGEIDLAVHIARKGRLMARDVINTMTGEEMEAYLEEKKRR